MNTFSSLKNEIGKEYTTEFQVWISQFPLLKSPATDSYYEIIRKTEKEGDFELLQSFANEFEMRFDRITDFVKEGEEDVLTISTHDELEKRFYMEKSFDLKNRIDNYISSYITKTEEECHNLEEKEGRLRFLSSNLKVLSASIIDSHLNELETVIETKIEQLESDFNLNKEAGPINKEETQDEKEISTVEEFIELYGELKWNNISPSIFCKYFDYIVVGRKKSKEPFIRENDYLNLLNKLFLNNYSDKIDLTFRKGKLSYGIRFFHQFFTARDVHISKKTFGKEKRYEWLLECFHFYENDGYSITPSTPKIETIQNALRTESDWYFLQKI
jgi:hypothetical protein